MTFPTLLLGLVLAGPVWAGDRQRTDNTGTSHINYEQTQRLNYVPGVYSDKRDERDRDFTGDPDREDLITMVGHVADIIADRNIPKDNLPGVDLFMDKLQEEMKQGTDLPRYEILMNAKQARDISVEVYDKFRQTLAPLIIAQEKLKAIETGLKPIVKKNTSKYVPAIKEAAETLKPPVQAIETDPPKASGPPANAKAVKVVEDQAKELKALKPNLEQAKEKLKDAKKLISEAEALVPLLKQLAQKAGDLEKKSQDRLAVSRTSGETRNVGRQELSKKVIENAEKWMKKTVKKAKEVHKKMEELTQPKEGYPKSLGAAEKASGAAMAGKQAIEGAEKGINQSQQKVKGPISTAYKEAKAKPDEAGMAQQVQKATGEKSKAEEAEQKGTKASEKAKKASDASKAASKKTTEKFKKLKDKLGNPSDADKLSDLPPMGIRVARPKGVAPTGGRYISRKTKSRKLTFPKDLTRNVGDVICDSYGERDCRTPGGNTIGRTAADRSGLTGSLVGRGSPGGLPSQHAAVSVRTERPGAARVASAKGIAAAAYGSWQNAWKTGKKTLAGGAREAGVPRKPKPGPLPENLANITPALVKAKNAEALIDTDPRRALMMAASSIHAMPNNPYAYFVRAKAHMRMRDYPKALAALDKAILLDEGESALLLYTKAEILNRMGRYEEAVAASKLAIEVEKETAHGYAQASWGFAGMREYAQSLEMMESAAMKDESYKPLLAAMRALKDNSRMLTLFEGERIVKADPSKRGLLYKFVREGKESYWLAFAVAVCLVSLGFAGILFDLTKDRLRRLFSRWKSPNIK